MGIGVKVTGADKAATWVNNITPSVSQYVMSRMANIAFETMREGSATHSRTYSTGKLRSSVSSENLTPVMYRVGHNTKIAPYAQWLLYGSEPHIIRPRNAKALRFKRGGNVVFARFVKHPGYVGDNYLGLAERIALAGLPGFVESALKVVP